MLKQVQHDENNELQNSVSVPVFDIQEASVVEVNSH